MFRKRDFFIWLLLGMLVLLWIPYNIHAAESINPSHRKIVKIQVESQEEIQELANLGEPWEVHKDYVIIDVTDKLMQKITDRGFSVEVLFYSLEEFSYPGPLPKAGPEGLYHSYSELKDELLQLEQTYPQIAKVYDIGDSWEKTQGIADRDIWAIKISDNVTQEEDEPEILFIGAHHAREWISVEVPLYLAKYLVENYYTDPMVRSYVDNTQIWIVPMLNPDGHQYSIDVDRWWRKNRRSNGGGSYGVDLNRNYGYMWGGPGSSPDPQSDIYRGTAPFSEPETQAIRDLALAHKFRAMLTYHSYGQLILYPWGYTYNPPPDVLALSNMSADMADLIQQVHGSIYTPQQASQLYLTSGTTDDWFYGQLDTFGFTIELRPVGYPYFILPEDQIIPTWEENRPVALYLISWSQMPVNPIPDVKANGSDGPLTIKSSDNLFVTIELTPGNFSGHNADWWVLADTSPFGWYYYNVNTGSWFPGQLVTYQGGLFNLPSYGVLNTTGLPTGTYTFYFGVDGNMNGSIDMGVLVYDGVVVNITP